MNEENQKPIKLDPIDFPILSQWESDRLEEVARAMVEADNKQPTRDMMFAYLAILESDLQGSLGVPTRRKNATRKS